MQQLISLHTLHAVWSDPLVGSLKVAYGLALVATLPPDL